MSRIYLSPHLEYDRLHLASLAWRYSFLLASLAQEGASGTILRGRPTLRSPSEALSMLTALPVRPPVLLTPHSSLLQGGPYTVYSRSDKNTPHSSPPIAPLAIGSTAHAMNA